MSDPTRTPIPDDDGPGTRTWQLQWLRTLIVQYQEEHIWGCDEDQNATHEMLDECRALLAELEAEEQARPRTPVPAPVVRDHSDIPF